MTDHRKTGIHVKNIEYLGKWLAELLDLQSNLILGLFPSTEPSKGLAYENSEGDKFKSKMQYIIQSDIVWYLHLNVYHQSEFDSDNLVTQTLEKIANDLNINIIKHETSLLRLLPNLDSHNSIEFLDPPLPFETEKGTIQKASFFMLADLYDTYLESKET